MKDTINSGEGAINCGGYGHGSASGAVIYDACDCEFGDNTGSGMGTFNTGGRDFKGDGQAYTRESDNRDWMSTQ